MGFRGFRGLMGFIGFIGFVWFIGRSNPEMEKDMETTVVNRV